MFDLADRFNLELHWDKTVYEQPGECKIIGAYFCGPVLQIAQQINSNDKIRIDFYSQYLYCKSLKGLKLMSISFNPFNH